MKDEAAAAFVQRVIADSDLLPDVPADVRAYFETARRLHVYGLFVYEFFTLAADRALFACEFALRERYKQSIAQTQPDKAPARVPMLRGLLRCAKSEGILSSRHSDRSLEALAALRNFGAHPDMNRVAMPSDSARMIAGAAILINELWSP